MTQGSRPTLDDLVDELEAEAPAVPRENPKALVGRKKATLISAVPAISLAWLAEAHMDGAIKYGALNWRESKIKRSDYIDAAVRHILALKEGEDVASDSFLPHAAHIMATMSIILDAEACGTLIDDRVHGNAKALAEVQGRVLEARVRRIEAKAA
ncbi:dATP/dGTP diphosphohydrolase domain-containing protein [Aureimonas glaciei]|uniref:dATP/dGTP diphosphohydrolase N-terminal domain-containing protein n=1 Tax=Aureimonas glaciei TaxID=1776957 RepID=A0A916YAS3_9HYPH|nr:dATP/dGTP diphosphohydrolase domain-containing protein [Aureimonas glaciei]GGD38212.1 hypothetical protein GCM10011335_46170 [Aureimonas glaciei]